MLVALGIVVISVYKQTDLAFSFEGLLGPMTAPAAEQRNYWHYLITTLSWGLGYMGMPHILNKFAGISEKSHMHRAKWLGLTWQTLSLGLAFCIGRLGLQFFDAPLPNNELIFVEMVKTTFTPFFAGIILCSMLRSNDFDNGLSAHRYRFDILGEFR